MCLVIDNTTWQSVIMSRYVLNCFFFLIPFFLMLPLPANAQENVGVRTGVHEDYTRLVVDWEQRTDYEVNRTAAGTLTLRFDRAASVSLSGVQENEDILDVRRLSDAGQPLILAVQMPPGRDFRHFRVGSKVVLDILLPPGQKRTVQTPRQQKPEQVADSKPAVSAPPEPAEKPVTESSPKAMPVEEVEAQPVEEESREKPQDGDKKLSTVEEAAADFDAHVIEVSMTESVGMSVFERNGWLWMVMDRANVNVPPQIEGPESEKFPAFERMDLKGGVAFRLKLPGEKKPFIYAEGGGLIWRVILTPVERTITPVPMERSFEQGEYVRGGRIIWPLKYVTKKLDIVDPAVGDTLTTVTVEQADQFAGYERRLAEFDTLQSIAGLTVKPKALDLKVDINSKGVEITRPDGLALSRVKDVNRRRIREQVQNVHMEELMGREKGNEMRRIFDFDRWMMGGLQALDENQKILLATLADKDRQGRVQDLLSLAKMNLANDRGQEALGYLAFALSELPAIEKSPEYKALRGASYALAGKYDPALRDLNDPALEEYSELDYWRAYTLAWLGDWQQAVETAPDSFSVLITYPQRLLEKIGLKLAEVALRDGDVPRAEAILSVLQKDSKSLWPWTKAGISYLKGEAHRQSGEYDRARELWEPLTRGKDDYYRARAGLALALLDHVTNNASLEESIDRLEGLRYAWRGDELEAHINFLLGKLYIEQDRYLKGFTILRDAASMSPDTDVSREITAYMKEAFKNIFFHEKDLSALDAVSVYEEFRELTPTGDEGNRLVQSLAERLVEADLLDRAAAILQHQVDFRLEGPEKADVAVRLAAIYLLDRDPDKALAALNTAEETYKSIGGADDKLREVRLLRARALSQKDMAEEALALLGEMSTANDVNRLRADIAWNARLWEDAAEALHDLILDEALDLGRPLSREQAELILNRAVALNLASNRVALANMRKRYGEAMKKTPRARLFDIITRQRKTAIMADRQTIESIVSEVDMFKDFLESYKATEDVSN